MNPLRLLAAAIVLAALPSVAAADTRFGLRVGYYFDAEAAFVGGEALSRIANRVYFNPNIEFAFPENATLLSLNGDLHYDLASRGSAMPWIGAGLGILRYDREGRENADTDVGLNLLGGVGWRRGGTIPYVQAKLVLKDGSEFVIALGLRF